MRDFLKLCESRVALCWEELKRGPFWTHMREHGIDRDLYVGMMTEIYHYTHHNAQNQALAAVRVGSERLELLRFCLHHAYDEVGHDLMVLKDLKAVGVDPESVKRRRPLPETEAFIAFLYRVASTRDATARIGYSYWAESCYTEIRELLDTIRAGVGIGDRDMSFFVVHEGIDRKHFEEVQAVVRRCCTTDELREDFLDVMVTSLHLQGQMLDAVWRAWKSARVPVQS
jgi:pyrroloquinoline quinone (PQQ) biosynthesis protein C